MPSATELLDLVAAARRHRNSVRNEEAAGRHAHGGLSEVRLGVDDCLVAGADASPLRRNRVVTFFEARVSQQLDANGATGNLQKLINMNAVENRALDQATTAPHGGFE